jgi:hypothetical protein
MVAAAGYRSGIGRIRMDRVDSTCGGISYTKRDVAVEKGRRPQLHPQPWAGPGLSPDRGGTKGMRNKNGDPPLSVSAIKSSKRKGVLRVGSGKPIR